MDIKMTTADSLLKEIAALPGANYLLEYAKAGPRETRYTDLFDWILTGKHNFIGFNPARVYNGIKGIVETIIIQSNDTKLGDQIREIILDDLKKIVDSKQLVKRSQLVYTVSDLEGELDMMWSLYPVAKFILADSADWSMYQLISEYIIDPSKPVKSIVEALNGSNIEKLLRSAINLMVKYLIERKGMSEEQVDGLSLDELFDLYNRATSGRQSGNIQVILDYLAPEAPEVGKLV